MFTLHFTESLLSLIPHQLNCVLQLLSCEYPVKKWRHFTTRRFSTGSSDFPFLSVWSNKLFIRIEKRLEIVFAPLIKLRLLKWGRVLRSGVEKPHRAFGKTRMRGNTR